MSERKLITADVVYDGLGTPRSEGAVIIGNHNDDATIVAISDLETARQRFPNTPEQHVGFALSPPPVNAHTHLDLSRMPFSPGPYEAFIAKVVAHARAGGRGLAAAKEGIEALEQAGTRAVGDIVTDEETMRFLLTSDLQGVAYWEVFSPDPASAEAVFNETVDKLRAFKKLERPGGMRVGLAPHTPHTVSALLLKKLAALAHQNELPLQIHVAETAGEIALHRDGTGPLATFMRPHLPDWQPSGLSPVQYLKRLGVLEAAPTLVHVVHVDEEDVRTVQKAGCVVVHCPRSNIALECGRFPWRLYAKHGVTVAFGTDSLGSSPSLDVIEEVAAARTLHGAAASPLALVRAAVKGGSRALGLTPPKVLKGDAFSHLYVWQR